LNAAGISAHDIKTVFRSHCVEPESNVLRQFSTSAAKEPYIPVRSFKDKFLPTLGYKKDEGVTDIKS
jgi:hypothetical protein